MSAKTVFEATISVALTLSSAGIFAAEGESLFDGASLAGWEGDAKWWRVEDGAITGEIPADSRLNQNQFLFWNEELHDFELRFQYRISGHLSANSGVQFRCQKHRTARRDIRRILTAVQRGRGAFMMSTAAR